MSTSGGWQKRSIPEIEAVLGSDPQNGLTKSRVHVNRHKWGRNELWYTGSPFMFFRTESIFSLLGYIIMAITALSAAAFDKCFDSVFVAVVLLIGIAISALSYILLGLLSMKHSSKWIPVCTVVRDGKHIKIKANSLVLGDIVVLGRGERAYADLKLVLSDELAVREPGFTKRKGSVKKAAIGMAVAAEGQSLPEDFIYAGSEVIEGAAKGIVCAVGDNTRLGKQGKVKLTQNRDTPRLASLRRRSVIIGAIGLMFSFVAVFAGVFIPVSAFDFIGLFILFLSFAVSVGGEIVPALCSFAYYLAINKSLDNGLFIRDVPGVDCLVEADGICVENSSLMKSDRTVLKSVWVSGGITDVGDSVADELFSLMLAGTAYGDGRYGSEALLAVNAHMSGKGDVDKYIASTMNTKPVLDHKIVGATHYSLFASGAEQYFAVTGSIDDVISKCTKLRINGEDRPISRDDVSNILSSASDALKIASSIIAVGVRVSPYNNIKRLSVLTSDLSFIGFIAMETPAHPLIPTGLVYMRQHKVPFIICTDGSGEDISFARKLGIIKNREDLVTDNPEKAAFELLSEDSLGGALSVPTEEYIAEVLSSAKKSGKRLVYIGSEKYSAASAFSVVSDEGVPSTGAYLKCAKGSEASALIESYIRSRKIFGRLDKVHLYLFISALLRAVYCLTAIFGMPYIYPSLLLAWGLIFDFVVSVAILTIKGKKIILQNT